eukprot:294537-Amphidinium_carterae.1
MGQREKNPFKVDNQFKVMRLILFYAPLKERTNDKVITEVVLWMRASPVCQLLTAQVESSPVEQPSKLWQIWVLPRVWPRFHPLAEGNGLR